MTIAAKVTTGFGVLVALMMAVLAYQVVTIHQLLTLNREFSRLESRSQQALGLLQLRDLVEENAQKYFSSKDPDYRERLREFRAEFDAELATMKSLSRLPGEVEEIDQLARDWEEFTLSFSQAEPTVGTRVSEELPVPVAVALRRVRLQCDKLFAAEQRAIATGAEASVRASRQAEWISWTAALAALSAASLVSIYMVRAIARPLRELTAGTKAVAAGTFAYRLDASRDDEFAQLAREFNRMSERLNELDQMKKDFVSHISHELKTPLASMRECFNLLNSEIPGPVTDKQRRFLRLGIQSGERLSTMLGNLLDISRMEAGMMEYEVRARDLTRLLRTALEEFEAPAQELKILLRAEIPHAPMLVECDGDRIVQVVGNLLGNAAKFSPKESDLVVRLWWQPHCPAPAAEAQGESVSQPETDAGFAVFSIADRGPGIPDTEKTHIFEKFHQVHGGAKPAGRGAGLGLAICRTIVHAHRGSLWVEDNAGGGSVFFVALPVGRVDRADSVKRFAAAPV